MWLLGLALSFRVQRPRAFAFRLSYSTWLIAPVSSSFFASAICSAGLVVLAATCLASVLDPPSRSPNPRCHSRRSNGLEMLTTSWCVPSCSLARIARLPAGS